MRLTNVELYCSSSESVTNFNFRDPQSRNPYTVKGFYGIDADEIVASFDGVGLNSGNSQYSLSLKKRDLVIRTVLNPNFSDNQSVSDLRDHLYRMIASNRNGNVKVKFLDGDIVRCVATGYVTKLEAVHFEAVPEVQITVNCPDPLFRDPQINLVEIIESEDVVVFDDFVSTAPHGCVMTLEVLNNTPSIDIRDTEDEDIEWRFRVLPPVGSANFLSGDHIVIRNEFRNRQVYIERGSTKIQIADRIAPNPAWPVIFPGSNKFVVENPEDYVISEISHNYAFWGV